MSKVLNSVSVWLVAYRHRYGTDNVVCTSRKAALDEAFTIMLDSMRELDNDKAKPILALLVEDKVGEAIVAWGEAWEHEECIEIDEFNAGGVSIERHEINLENAKEMLADIDLEETGDIEEPE